MKNNYPEIRFDGYDIEWSMKKLGDITDIKDSSRISNTLWISNGVPYLRSSDLSNDNIKGELFLSRKTYQEYSAKTGAPTRGDLLFTSGGKIGVTYYKEDDDELYVQGGSILYAKTSESEHLDGRFLKSYFDTPILKKYIENSSTGLTIKHFTLKPAKDTPIAIPELDEQKKIGLFFKDLDDTISLHQQELEALKQSKEGFLQKMFPRDGENIPEVRFLEFTNKWNEENLKSVFKDFIVPMRDKPREFSGDIPWTRIEDIEGRYLNGTKSGQFVSENTVKSMNLKVIPKGALIVSASATFGIVAIVNTDLITNQTFIGLVPNEEFDLNFLYSLFQSTGVRKKLKKESAGSTIFYISRKQFEGLVSYFPEREEQVKIGEFFRQLDEVIELKEKELEALKETKKGFLQKMFV